MYRSLPTVLRAPYSAYCLHLEYRTRLLYVSYLTRFYIYLPDHALHFKYAISYPSSLIIPT